MLGISNSTTNQQALCTLSIDKVKKDYSLLIALEA